MRNAIKCDACACDCGSFLNSCVVINLIHFNTIRIVVVREGERERKNEPKLKNANQIDNRKSESVNDE